MTAGAFLTCEPMVKVFGLHEMKNKAEAIRRVWPDLIPKGKEKIGVYEAAYCIYVFAVTEGIKEIYDRDVAKHLYAAWHETYSPDLGKNLVTALGDLISQRNSEDVLSVAFSKNHNSMTIVTESNNYNFPDQDFRDDFFANVFILYNAFFKSLNALFGDFEPEWSYSEDNEVLDINLNIVGKQQGDNVIDSAGKIIAKIDGYRLIKL